MVGCARFLLGLLVIGAAGAVWLPVALAVLPLRCSSARDMALPAADDLAQAGGQVVAYLGECADPVVEHGEPSLGDRDQGRRGRGVAQVAVQAAPEVRDVLQCETRTPRPAPAARRGR